MNLIYLGEIGKYEFIDNEPEIVIREIETAIEYYADVFIPLLDVCLGKKKAREIENILIWYGGVLIMNISGGDFVKFIFYKGNIEWVLKGMVVGADKFRNKQGIVTRIEYDIAGQDYLNRTE